MGPRLRLPRYRRWPVFDAVAAAGAVAVAVGVGGRRMRTPQCSTTAAR